MSPSYIDGYSTFYVDQDSKIYQHTIDKIIQDKEKDASNDVVKRLVNLQQKSAPSPAL